MLTPAAFSDVIDALPKARLAIGLSGGGDSTALVHLCRKLEPKPLILIVDHALREGSAQEANQAKTLAESFGLEARILTWVHDGVTGGIQEKARKARYALMGQACRETSVAYLLTAHTQNDQAETLVMRYDRGTGWRGAAGMRRAAYGPLWPELAEVTLLRPLLDVSRDDLRTYNRENALSWIEDPSNQDEGFARIRARRFLKERPNLGEDLLGTAKELRAGFQSEKTHLKFIADRSVKIDDHGLIRVYGPLPSMLWEFVLRAASGTGGPIGLEKIKSLKKAVSDESFSGLTLAGAHVTQELGRLCVGPDPSVYKGRYNRPAIAPINLEAGKSVIWDGRFKVKSNISDAVVMTADQAVSLYPDIRELEVETNHSLIFNEPPVPFTGAMPIVIKDEEMVSNLGLRPSRGAEVTSLVARRLQEMLKP